MKSKTIVFAALLVAAVMVLFAPRQARADVDFSYFYENLVPYGDWVDVDQYGYCWMPRGMAPDWRPYTDGYWTYTDAGWTWVSYEDFGSITYHYGRWVRLEEVGWVWKPDYRWGPAWVSWRQSDRYVGWAPLPPDVAFDDDNGVGVWVDRDYDIGPSAYAFCETRYFGAPVIRNVIVPVRRNIDILDVTVNITNITVIGSRDYGRLVYCGGPNYRWIAERSERPINRLELVLRTNGDWIHRGRPELSRHVGAQLFINAPVIVAPRDRHFAPSRVAREIRAPRIDKGWAFVSDPRDRDRIHHRYEEQTRGLTSKTAPAYRVNEAEVRSFVREPRPSPTMQQQQYGGARPQGMQPQVQPAQMPKPMMTAPARQTAPQPMQPAVQPAQTSQPMAAPVQQTAPQPTQVQSATQPAQLSRPTGTPAQQTAPQPQSSHRPRHSVQPEQMPKPTAAPTQQTAPQPQRLQPSVQPTQMPKPTAAPVQQTAPQPQRVQPSVQPTQMPKPTAAPIQQTAPQPQRPRPQVEHPSRPTAAPAQKAPQVQHPAPEQFQRRQEVERPRVQEPQRQPVENRPRPQEMQGRGRQERPQPQVQQPAPAAARGAVQQTPSSSNNRGDRDNDRKKHDRQNDPNAQ